MPVGRGMEQRAARPQPASPREGVGMRPLVRQPDLPSTPKTQFTDRLPHTRRYLASPQEPSQELNNQGNNAPSDDNSVDLTRLLDAFQTAAKGFEQGLLTPEETIDLAKAFEAYGELTNTEQPP